MDEEPFEPHGVILTEREIPSPIFVAAVTGSARSKLVALDQSLPPIGWIGAMREEIARRRMERETIPGFGRITGFVINYRPDHAVRFTLDGEPVETLSAARRVGSARLSQGGRALARDGKSPVLSGGRDGGA